jgi:small-conductance mechanosensitive channel
MPRPNPILLSLCCLTMAPAAVAQALPTLKSSSAPAEAEAPAPTIAPDQSAADDARLQARIRAIFGQIPALQPVNVTVSAGVVTLSGTVADQKAIDQAEAISGRLSGVVTVQNKLTRDLEVDRNLTPALSGVTGKAAGLWRALPLIGVAVIVAVLVGMLGYAIAGRRGMWQRIAPNPFLADLLATAIRFAFVVGGIVLALDIVGATALLGAVLGGAGVIGIALGFAVRDSIDNYVSSLMLSVRQPFRANDSVRIDDQEGRVVRLTSRATVLITGDGNHLRIPNSTVFKAVILNFTTNPQRLFKFDYPIAHDADPCRARNVGLETLGKLSFVLPDPPPGSELVDMAGPVQLLRFSGWIDQTAADFGKGRTQAMESVRDALREAGFPAVAPAYRVRLLREKPGEEAAIMAPAADPSPAEPSAGDVAPDRHIEAMVAHERAVDDEGADLLDAHRPVE